MTCGIYQILNTITGKCYVGSSIAIEKRWILHKNDLAKRNHHSAKLQHSWNKYGPNVWEWEILQESEETRLIWLEAFWMGKLNSHRNGYNIRKITLDGRQSYKTSEETKIKLSNSGKGRVVSEETRKKIGNIHRGKIASEETRKKLREVQKGRKHSEETRKKMSGKIRSDEFINSLKNISEETKSKIAKTRTGMKHSEETIKKMKETKKNISEETKKKLKESALRRWAKVRESGEL